MNRLWPLFFVMLVFWGCNESLETNPVADLKIRVNFLMNGSPLELFTKEYQNAAGNKFTVEEFKFYLSNLKLRNQNTGAVFQELDSYHLVSRKAETHIFEITIPDVPTGLYTHLEFAIGVDPARNLSIDQVGDLDPNNNMAWDWNTGYKFILLEGRFFSQNSATERGLVFHVGGDANYRELSFPLVNAANEPWELRPNNSAVLQLDTEAANIFTNPHPIDFEQYNVVMFGPEARLVADNYAADMIQLRIVELSQ